MPDEMKTVANNGIYQKDYTVAGTIEGGPAPKGVWDRIKDTASEIGQRMDSVNATLTDPNANTVDKVKSIAGLTDGFLGLHDSMNATTQYLEPYTMSRANDNNLAGYLYARVYAKPNYDSVKRDKAIEIGNKLDINPDIILSASDDGFARAIEISNQMDRGRTYEDVTKQYPELLNMRYGSLASAEQTFDNVQNINKTRGVFDSIQQSLWAMNDQMLLGYAGYKLAGTKDEGERQDILKEIDRLQNNLQNYRQTDTSDMGSKIIGDSLAQGYMMGVQAIKGANRAAQGMAVGVGLGAAGGAAVGGIGVAPGAVAGGLAGLRYGAQVGMAEQMYQTSFGSKYIELIQKKDANGNNVYSHDEAYSMAQKFAAIDTGIEFYAMKLGAKAVTKATPASRMAAQAITTGVDTTVATMNKGMGAVVGQAMKRGVQAGIPELVEEGLQDANEKIQHNLFRKDNDPEGTYSVGDIASGALGAMAQAAPSVIGLTGLGGLAGGIRVAHDLRKWNSLTVEQQNAALQAEQNRNAQALMANIRNDAKTNKLAKDNPEVYGQLVQKYAQNAQVPTAYVNVHELVETPEGQNAIREMVDAGIVSDEDVAKSIEAETPIEVPLGQFAQKATNLSDNAMEAMKDTTYYTEGGRSMQTIEKDKEAYAQAQQDVSNELKDHKANVKQEIIAEHFPDATESQKEVLNEVLDAPDDVKRTYNAAVLQAQTDFREKYNSEYQNFQMAKKNGFDISPESEDNNGSNVTTAEKERMGVIDYNRRLELEMAKNDPDATEIINQKYDTMAKEAKAISELESMSDHIDKIADGEVAMRMNFSKDGYQVFQDVYKALKQSPNAEVATQAKHGALLFASHADVMANIMQKAGKSDFTAKDYMNQYIRIQTGEKGIGSGFTQPLNPGVDPNTNVNIIDITIPGHHKVNFMSQQELVKYVRSNSTGTVLSKDKLASIGIKDYQGAKHLAWNFTKRNKGVHRASLTNLKSLIENAVLIESVKNNKKDFNMPISKTQSRKNEVEVYHRFYTPVIFGNSIYVVRLVGEERQNKITINPTKIDLYSVVIENKNRSIGYDRTSDNSVTHTPSTITIQDMLKGVNDSQGNPYFQKAYHGSPHDFNEFDLGAIGSGEGAIGHGWGLYFAKNKSVAKNYKAVLSEVHGSTKSSLFEVDVPNNNVLLNEQEPYNQQPSAVKDAIYSAYQALTREQKELFVSTFKDGKFLQTTSLDEARIEYEGYQRDYNIVDNYTPDKKMSKITQRVLGLTVDKYGYSIDDLSSNKSSILKVIGEKLSEAKALYDNELNKEKEVTEEYIENPQKILDSAQSDGRHIYESFVKTLGTPREASLALRKEGIEGITYDGEQDGRCYVVFDDKAIKVIAKYNQAKADEVVRGMTSMMSDDKKIIELFDQADFSTFVHESGHVFLEDLRMLATMEGAPEQVINDWEEVKKWTGYQEGADADTNRKAHEKFAQGFEAYVRDGSAPTQALQRAFRQFAQWLTRIYQKVSMLGGLPPKAIRDVMDRMLATEQDIEAWATDREIDRLETKVNMRELSETEQAALNNKVANIKERAKEKVRAEYVKELEEREIVPWDKVKDKAQDKIERQLVEQYPIYKERLRYEAFGVDALANTEHPTLQSLEEAEETKGIGKWHDVVNAQLESAKEAYEESNRTTVDNAALAEEWLLTHQAEQRLRLAEAEMIKDDIRKASARHYRALAKLQKIDTSKGDIELQVKQALGDLTDRERNRIERELGKESIADTKRSATDKEHDKMQAKLDKAEQASSNKIDKLESKHQDTLEKVNAKHQAQVTALKNVISKHMLQLRDLKNMHNETLSASMKKAEAKLSKLTVSQATKYKRFVRESVTAGKKADIAFSKAKPYLAYSLKQEQLMKTSMARVSFEINQEITKERTKLLKQLQRIGSANSTVKLDPQSRYWYQHMMYQLGISTRDGMMPADGNFDLPSVYAVLDADALLADGSTKEVVPPSVGTVWFSKTPMDYTQMSVSDFREVAEVMNAIYHNSRTEHQASTIKDDKGNAISVNQAAQELVEQASKTMGGIPDQNLLDKLNSETWKAKTSNSVSGKLLELAKAETILNRFDGGQKGGGVWYRYIYEPINRATNDAKERTEIAMKWLSSAISNSYSKKELFNIRNVKGYKLGDVSNMTKEQVISAALNWGTEANRQRVLETFNTTEVEVAKAFADILNDKDWNFIESTWNHINSYFDERNQVQERLYGTPMKKEQGVKFTINGRDIEGQYYPIVYDPRLDNKSSDYEIEDIIKSQMSSNAVMGMGLSATKQRMATVKGKKLLLSLDVIPSAITESINHIAMREAVTDVNKLIQHHEVENAIVQTLGRDVHQYLKQWVRDNWQTEISKTSRWDRILSTLRRNSTGAVMMYRFSTAALNVLNTIPAMHKMGAINVLSAVKSFYFGGPLENIRFVMSKSVFLRERIQNLDKDMKNGMKIDGKSPFNTGTVVDSAAWRTSEMQEAVNRYGYFFITETDLMLSMPIWMHEYESKKSELIGKEGYTPDEIESRAIEAGDRMVRSIFGSGDVKDQAAIQRKNNSLINLFTPFYSYSNTVFNALLESGWLSKDSGNWWKLAHSFLFWILLQSVAETLLRSLWDDDKDDADTITKKAIKSIGSSTVQGFPIIRDILGAAGSAITGDSTTSRGSEVVALSMTSKLSKTLGDALFRQGKVHPTDVGRGATEVVNRLVPGGFSDTLTDGAWTMAKWLLTDTDSTVLDLATAIAMDKKIRTREEQKKHNAFVKRQEHKK
nr:MAG TPA: crystallin beta/gamma motif-containing protein [Caudoviricetes sp.]